MTQNDGPERQQVFAEDAVTHDTPAAEVLRQLLDHVGLAVFAVDSASRIRYANAAARTLATAGDGVDVRDGRLLSPRLPARGARARVVAHTRPAKTCTDVETIERRAATLPLHVCFAPLQPPASDLTAVFVADPATRCAPGEALFERLYGLTPMQAKLAVALLRLESLSHAARELGVSINTARTHLKEIFEKTATRRQADLIRLLTSGLAVLDVDY